MSALVVALLLFSVSQGQRLPRDDTKDQSKNYSLTTFDERARQLLDLKAKGLDLGLGCEHGQDRSGGKSVRQAL